MISFCKIHTQTLFSVKKYPARVFGDKIPCNGCVRTGASGIFISAKSRKTHRLSLKNMSKSIPQSVSYGLLFAFDDCKKR